ncbi:GDP-mannose 4,6-dehydratase, partial [bacterium]|nr:GDP-mannose 4,6-dehydratase [bacterium]
EMAFEFAGAPIEWDGEGIDEVGYCRRLDQVVIRINPEYYRPAEVDSLLGDSSFAQKQLGWKLNTSLEELVKEMVSYDLSIKKLAII